MAKVIEVGDEPSPAADGGDANRTPAILEPASGNPRRLPRNHQRTSSILGDLNPAVVAADVVALGAAVPPGVILPGIGNPGQGEKDQGLCQGKKD